jgi:uncharacterized membrane protein
MRVDAQSGLHPSSRVQSVDALRGLAMIIMALDHTRDFFHAGAMSFQPEDLTQTTAILFFTRWITHICAPVFMFTAGIGAFLWLNGNRGASQGRTLPGRSTDQLSVFLWTRGLWLVVLELTALRFAMSFSLARGPVLLTILWALGWSMVVLGFLVHVPMRWLAILSIAWVALHNLADPIHAAQFGSHAWIWNILHEPGAFKLGGIQFQVAYPLVPWIFVMAAGFCFGRLIATDPPQDSPKPQSKRAQRIPSPPAPRRRWTFRIGLGLTVAFLVIRAVNIYGDPQPWSSDNPDLMLLSFLKCTKYPPSLDFLLMTLGPALMLLGWFDRLSFKKTNPLIVFGRVPLFYFLVHFFIIHLLTFPFAWIRYGHAGFLLNPMPSLGGSMAGSMNSYPPDFGYPLWVVYAVWIAVVAMLYPLCLWFARLKERRSDWWLSYL